jgi:hypothetical protein
MTETKYRVTRQLNVTASGYEVIMRMTSTQFKGDSRVVQTLTVRTLHPHSRATSSIQNPKVVSDYDVA